MIDLTSLELRMLSTIAGTGMPISYKRLQDEMACGVLQFVVGIIGLSDLGLIQVPERYPLHYVPTRKGWIVLAGFTAIEKVGRA